VARTPEAGGKKAYVQKILVATDLDDPSKEAVAAAVALARDEGASLTTEIEISWEF
jgi:nucleotide-binding universal stress UspA family protein